VAWMMIALTKLPFQMVLTVTLRMLDAAAAAAAEYR
jgi:hypothetical protein